MQEQEALHIWESMQGGFGLPVVRFDNWSRTYKETGDKRYPSVPGHK